MATAILYLSDDVKYIDEINNKINKIITLTPDAYLSILEKNIEIPVYKSLDFYTIDSHSANLSKIKSFHKLIESGLGNNDFFELDVKDALLDYITYLTAFSNRVRLTLKGLSPWYIINKNAWIKVEDINELIVHLQKKIPQYTQIDGKHGTSSKLSIYYNSFVSLLLKGYSRKKIIYFGMLDRGPWPQPTKPWRFSKRQQLCRTSRITA